MDLLAKSLHVKSAFLARQRHVQHVNSDTGRQIEPGYKTDLEVCGGDVVTAPAKTNSGTVPDVVANALNTAVKALEEHHQTVVDLVEAHFNRKKGQRRESDPPATTDESKVQETSQIEANIAVNLPGSVCEVQSDGIKMVAPSSRLNLPEELPTKNLGEQEASPQSIEKLEGTGEPASVLNLRQAASSISETRADESGSDAVARSEKEAEEMVMEFKVLPAWQPHQHSHSRRHLLQGLHMISFNEQRKSKIAECRETQINNGGIVGAGKARLRSSMSKTSGFSRFTTYCSDDAIEDDDEWPADVMWFVLLPYSMRRGSWDICSLILVVYDMIVLPLEFFDLPESTPKTFFEWITRIFWTLDMGMSFITGFVTDDGTIEMSQTQITRRYLRTWFGLDLLVVGIDWAEVFVRSLIGVSYGRLAKVTRTFRIIRMVRLLRLARMKEVLGLITERFSSHKIIILSDIGKLLFFIVGLGHLIACLWFGIGNIADGDKGWVGHYEFNNRPIGDQYAMSMNWAMSQFVGGMDEITPENAGERVFAMVCLIIAFVIAALFISSITSSMTELQMLGSSETKKVSMLRIFLAQHKISSKLTMRVTRNAQHSMKEKNKSLPEDQIECLKLFVSEPLRMELHFEIFAPIFRMHPFFGRYIEEYPQVMRRVCHSAVAMEDVSGGDIIFHVGEIPQQPKMYFLCSGTLRYTATDNTKVDLQAGDWISEAVLWTLWMYRGELCATSNCRLCVLDAKQFQDMAGQFHHHGDFSPKQYAEQFVSRLSENAKTTNDFTDLTDFSDCSKTLKRSKTLVGSLAESR